MTLILTTIRPADVLITSDGRSTTSRDGHILSIKDDLQKIFPIPEHPVAVAHHGENSFDGKPIGQWVMEIGKRLNAGNMSLEEIADEFRARLHAVIRKRLRQTAGAGFGCGLLIAGFGARQRKPGAIEVFWKLQKDHLSTEERQWSPISLVTSGTGAAQIPKLDWNEVAGKPVATVIAYHAKTMDAAIKAKAEGNTVGGHVHELLITPEGCKWITAPKGT